MSCFRALYGVYVLVGAEASEYIVGRFSFFKEGGHKVRIPGESFLGAFAIRTASGAAASAPCRIRARKTTSRLKLHTKALQIVQLYPFLSVSGCGERRLFHAAF